MAYQVINNAETGLAVRNKLHNNFNELYTNKITKATSGLHASYDSYQIHSADASNGPIEILNLGEQGFTGYDDTANTFLVKVAWSFQMHFNSKWNNSLTKWEFHKANINQAVVEVGAEGVTLHATAPNVNLSDTWHAAFQVRGEGVTGTTGLTSGVFIQSKTISYHKYKSGTYTSDQHPWFGGTTGAENPFIWFHTEETKGTTNEALRIESNHANLTGLGIYFKKSGGSYNSRSAAADNSNAGFVAFGLWDGSAYQTTARIIPAARGAASAGSAPQKLMFQTSPDTTANLATHMEIDEDGNILMLNLPTASAGLATGSLWNDSGTLKIV